MAVEKPNSPILKMSNISKTFPGVKALNDVQLTVWPGEIHALMGENGAGKSTLMKVLSGAYQADRGGIIEIGGQAATINNPIDAKAKGIAVIYQELSLSPNLSVAENIYMGRELKSGLFIDTKTMENNCIDVLKELGASFGPSTKVAALSIAERQMVEIARAIHANAQILVMDEPTTALSSRETDKLFDLVKRLRNNGLAIIYISHRMSEIYELADRVSVLRDGTYVGELERSNLSSDALVRMMVGRDISGFYTKAHTNPHGEGEVILKVDNIKDDHSVLGCSFELHKGEVLCIAGLVGSGRTELARLIYGADHKTGGKLFLHGKQVDAKQPKEALDAGIVYLTEDRKAQGVFLDMSVHDNLNLIVCNRDAKAVGILDRNQAQIRSTNAIKNLAIRVATPKVEVGTLSGGNQQKVLLSRLLETDPKVLILDEPTRGVDVGAKSEIYKIIDDLVKSGIGIIVISSELPEVVGIADRVLVMRDGIIGGEVGTNGMEITQENIMYFATGAEQKQTEKVKEER